MDFEKFQEEGLQMTHRKSPFQSHLRNKVVNDFMEFNLLDLHNPEDTDLRQCIRAYTVVPKYAKKPDGRNDAAQKIVTKLRQINTKLNKEIGFEWKDQWRAKLPFYVQKQSLKDWFIGRASIPLIAISKLEDFGCKEEVEEIKQHLEYFTSTTGKIAWIPKNISKELAWLAAAIICDGYLHHTKRGIFFEVTDRDLVDRFRNTFCSIFQLPKRNFEVYNRPQSIKTLIRYSAENRPAVYFFHNFFEIPAGKKCFTIIVPKVIQKSTIEIKRAFLKGVFDTDGGKRRGGLGLTSASKQFRDQSFELLQEFGIQPRKDEWINKLYNKKYYGFQLKVDAKSAFLCRRAGGDNRDRFRGLKSHNS